MENEVPELDVKTLEYVCKMIEKDYELYSKQRAGVKTKKAAYVFQSKARAVDKIDRELHFLIYNIMMKQEA